MTTPQSIWDEQASVNNILKQLNDNILNIIGQLVSDDTSFLAFKFFFPITVGW